MLSKYFTSVLVRTFKVESDSIAETDVYEIKKE